jgi:hypothetical protein
MGRAKKRGKENAGGWPLKPARTGGRFCQPGAVLPRRVARPQGPTPFGRVRARIASRWSGVKPFWPTPPRLAAQIIERLLLLALIAGRARRRGLTCLTSIGGRGASARTTLTADDHCPHPERASASRDRSGQAQFAPTARRVLRTRNSHRESWPLTRYCQAFCIAFVCTAPTESAEEPRFSLQSFGSSRELSRSVV